ncbi:proprotein convertase subtilisin/kexin type 5-like isoform X2 [Mya arenaria]|uniref:proprotein convertase subtilisin/kexin type 5-like isoform X2 n=1 Tax=Mya arenaria TaxID=6604 RepID=UPI0022DF4B98|nr:proprotein convertase subtilisin/kexin type 5-like isoform X2 [Mya arenaria]
MVTTLQSCPLKIPRVISCIDGGSCPPDKPFCSAVGCSSTCPEPYFLNGSNCVLSCGNLLVNERQCVSSCPDGHFERESLTVAGGRPYIKKQCVEFCNEDEYIFNTSCVKTCPLSSPYIGSGQAPVYTKTYHGTRVSTNVCGTACSLNEPLKENYTVFGINYTRCILSCKTIIDGDFCVSECHSKRPVFEGRCVTKCPLSHPLLNSKYQCVPTCTSSLVLQKQECLCPPHLPVVYDGQCSASCNNLFMYPRTDVSLCVDSCKDTDFTLDRVCVELCPRNMSLYVKSCVPKCPVELPYWCETDKGQECSLNSGNISGGHFVCTNKCPPGMYVVNNVCASQCPQFSSNGECVMSCSTDRPYVFKNVTCLNKYLFTLYSGTYCMRMSKIITDLTCVAKCPAGYQIYSNECVLSCNAQLVAFNNSCVSACPEGMFVEETSATQISWQDNKFPISANYKKFDVIGIKEHINGTKCVAKCDKFVFNGKCIDTCPDSFPFEKNGSCDNYTCGSFYYESKTNKAHLHCVPRCNNGDVSIGYQCFQACPESAYQYGDTCVMSCPPEAPFIEVNITSECRGESWCRPGLRQKSCRKFCSKTVLNITSIASCVDVCPPPLLEYNKRCVQNCPVEAPFINNTFVVIQQWQYGSVWKVKNVTKTFNECVFSCDVRGKPLDKSKSFCTSECPSNLPFIISNVCSSGCNEAMLRNNESFGIECVHECPKGKVNVNNHCLDPASCGDENAYEYDGRCVTSCPKERPFGMNGVNRSCIADCGKDHLYSNGTCINKSNCKESMIVFKGQCLEKCPDGYGSFYKCYHVMFFVLFVIGVFGLLTFFIGLGRQIFKEYFIVLRMIVSDSYISSTTHILSKSLETSGLELEDDYDIGSFGIDIQGFDDDVPLLRLTGIVDTSEASTEAQTLADVHATESDADETLCI